MLDEVPPEACGVAGAGLQVVRSGSGRFLNPAKVGVLLMRVGNATLRWCNLLRCTRLQAHPNNRQGKQGRLEEKDYCTSTVF